VLPARAAASTPDVEVDGLREARVRAVEVDQAHHVVVLVAHGQHDRLQLVGYRASAARRLARGQGPAMGGEELRRDVERGLVERLRGEQAQPLLVPAGDGEERGHARVVAHGQDLQRALRSALRVVRQEQLGQFRQLSFEHGNRLTESAEL
jgi:hypothetical protein